MRSLYFSLVGALTLMTTAIGCDHTKKWHETGFSEPYFSGHPAEVAPQPGLISPILTEPPMK